MPGRRSHSAQLAHKDTPRRARLAESQPVQDVRQDAPVRRPGPDLAQMEAALRESEARFRALANAVPTIVWTAAPDGTITYANDEWFRYVGLTPEQNARGWPELVLHPDDRERCLAQWTQALRDGSDYEIEVRNRRYDGVFRWFLTRAVPIRDAAGRITAWYGTTTDIHERKQLE